VDELIAFLRKEIDLDEERAKRAGVMRPSWVYDREKFRVLTAEGQPKLVTHDGKPLADRWVIAGRKDREEPLHDVDGEHIVRHDPTRVLREVEAKRKILDGFMPCPQCLAGQRCIPHDSSAGTSSWRFLDDRDERTARLLASPYADQPGYREEWKP